MIPDTIYTLFSLVAIPSSASAPNLFHPILTLTVSLVMVCLYGAICFLHTLIIYNDESNTYNKSYWDSLGYAEVGFQGVLGLLHAGMALLSCIAVHRWRRPKKGARADYTADLELTPSTKDGRASDLS